MTRADRNESSNISIVPGDRHCSQTEKQVACIHHVHTGKENMQLCFHV